VTLPNSLATNDVGSDDDVADDVDVSLFTVRSCPCLNYLNGELISYFVETNNSNKSYFSPLFFKKYKSNI